MSDAKFYLKNPKNTKEKQLIYLIFSFNNTRLKYSTGESIIPSAWNPTSQRARANNDLNDFLKKLANDVESIERRLRTDGVVVTPNLLRAKLDELCGKNQPVKHNLFSFITEYLEKVEKVKKESTLKGYRNTFKHLQNFKKRIRKEIDFDNVNQEFYNSFLDYLIHEKKFAKNTIGKQIKNLKVFMSESAEMGIHKNQEYKSRKFKVLTEDVDSIYLNERELQLIYNLDLSENIKLEKVRDLFIVGCYTGLRFSDFSSLQAENIDLKGGYIKVKTQKMNHPAVIPIHKYVKEIITKYKKQYSNFLPPALTNQKTNEYLKDIGELAEINENIQVSHIKGNKRETKVYPKYELITTHTARRSFATNLYLADFPSISIMNITSHKTERAFLKYIMVTPEQHAQKLKKFWEKTV